MFGISKITRAFPIVERELRSAARRPGTHRIRLGLALAALVLFTGVLLFFPVSGADQGMPFYVTVTVMGLAYALFAGVLLTADAIAGERERGTLGLLFLTDLRPRDVLLGKLATSSINGLYALVGLLPLLALPILMGGVTMGEVFRHSVLLVGTLFLSMVVGLHSSSASRDAGQALGRGIRIILVLIGLSFLLGLFATVEPIFLFGPLNGYLAMFERRGGNETGYFIYVMFQIGLLVFLFFRSARNRLSRRSVWEKLSPPAMVESRSVVPSRPSSGTPRQPAVFGNQAPPPEGLMDSDPILWLLWRRNRFPRADQRFLITTLLIGVPLVVGAFWMVGTWMIVLLMGCMLQGLMVAHMSSQSCKRIGGEDDRAAMEFLLTTPRAARGTLSAYHRAFCQLFQTQFWWLVGLHLILVLAALLPVRGHSGFTLTVALTGLGLLFVQRFALSWIGLSVTLRHGSYHRAVLANTILVVLPVWGGLLLLLLMLILWSPSTGEWALAWIAWTMIAAGVPLAAGAVHRFRAVEWMRQHGSLAEAREGG